MRLVKLFSRAFSLTFMLSMLTGLMAVSVHAAGNYHRTCDDLCSGGGGRSERGTVQ